MMNLIDSVKQTVINAGTSGISMAELLLQHPGVARRTVQRWIRQFTKEGDVVAFGQGRSRRYRAINKKEVAQAQSYIEFSQVPLSVDSNDVLSYISQPLEARQPIGYQEEFLEAYQPNKTWYLSESLRRQLRVMGNSQESASPAGTYGRAILSRLLVDLSWASSHLEGNTYSLLDTRELIEHGNVADNKAAFETQMILNHKAAIELLVDNADAIRFDRFTLLNLHGALSENLLPNPSDEGRIRSYIVEIGKSVFRPLAIPAKINELFNLVLEKVSLIEDPFEQAFFSLVHLPYLQPFADVNKRTSRLAANIPLIRENLCPLTFLGVSQELYSKAILGVYEMTRVELLRDLFVWAYERSTQEYLAIKQNLVEPDPLRLAFRSTVKEIINKVVRQYDRDPLAVIREEVEQSVAESDRQDVEALVIAALRQLHEGSLARYGLGLSEFAPWKEKHR